MDAFRKITVLCVLFGTLAACGGGGGNGGGNPVDPGNPDPSGGQALPDSLYDIPEIAAFTPIVPAPDYDGITGQASLSRENSFYFIEALYQLLEPSYDVGSTQFYLPKPAILDYSYDSVADANCVNGSMDHAVHESGAQVVQVITLDHCVTEDNSEIHGQLVVDVNLDGEGRLERSEAFFRNLNIKLDGEEFTYHGQVTTNREGVLSVDFFTIDNGPLEATYHTEDLQIDDGATRGRIYHSDWGYVDLSTQQGEPESIQLTGGSNSYLNMVLEFWNRQNLALTLSSSDIEDQYGSALTTTVPLEVLFDWPYRDNREPEGELDAPEIIDLDQMATLDASAYSDADHDFLTHQWRWLNRPEGCEGPALQTGPTVEFSGQCRGTHDIELVVEDGFHTSTIPFSVTVAGPLPQLAESVVVEHSGKSETLSFGVNLENETEAGPVSYRLAYGPPGIEVDQTGTVSGVPKTLFQTQGGSVHIGIEVSNERSVEQEVTVNYSGRDVEILAENRGGFPDDESGTWQDINGDGDREQLVDYSNTFAIIEIRDGSTRYGHLEAREFSTFSLQDKGVMDYDDDGEKDIVLVYSDKYVVLSGQDFSLIEERAIQPAVSEDRSAVLVPGLNPGIYYESNPDESEWSYYEFASGERFPRVGPSSHGLRVADLSGDGYHSLVATYVVDLDSKPAVLNADGTTQRLEAYPSTVADIDGDGTDDVVTLQFQTSVDQATMASYSESTGKLQITYTLDVPEFEGEYHSFETRFVNLDNEPGDELVLLKYRSDQIYILKRIGTVFELVKRISYPERGDRTLFSARESLSQFSESSAILEGNTEAGQMFEFSLLSDPVNHDSGFDAYSEQPDSLRGLQRISETPNSTELLGVRRWFDEEGEYRKELTLNTVTSELAWNSQAYPDLPVPYDLQEVTTISSADGTEEYLLYSHGPNDYSVVDLNLEQVVATGSAVAMAYGAGDLDGDGRTEAYGLSNNSLYRLNSDTYEFEPVDNTLPSRTFERLGPVVATFGGKTPALFVPWDFMSSGTDPRLDIYQYEDGSLQRTGSIEFDVYPYPLFMGYAQQDVNGDGAPELIVWNTDKTTSYWVIDSSLSVVAKATTSSPLAGIFNLPTHASNDLIAFEQGRGTGNWRDTRIIQIDTASGQVTTRSSILPGETQKNGLTCLGDTLEECTKQVVTNLGVFSLK